MNYKHNTHLTQNAKDLRRNLTKEERHLWYDFLRGCPVRFIRQKVIDDYIADFYCSKAKLIVELDGSQHYECAGMQKDGIRTERLESRGLTVIRIPNCEIWHNFNGVCEYIDAAVKEPLSQKESPSQPIG